MLSLCVFYLTTHYLFSYIFSICQSIGVSPFPVLMAIGIAASCAFTTPVATPPNTLILGPGKFHFMDYVKVGLPLVLVSMIVCTVIIPLVWPF